MASIDKVGAGYRVRYRTPDGRSRSQTFRLKVDAVRFANAKETSKLTGTFVDPKLARKTFEDWWKEWREQRVDIRPSTRARDDSYARNHILPGLGRYTLGQLDHAALQAWVAEMSAKDLAPATVVKAAHITSRCLRGAVKARLIPFNPADGIDLPRVEAEEMRFLTPAQVDALADAIDSRYRTFVLVGAYGGLRLGELAGLRRHRVDLMRGRIDVAEIVVEVRGHHVVGPPKTRAGRRSVPLPRFVTDALVDSTAGMAQSDLLFPSPHGGPLRASLFRRRVWQPACVAAGVGAWVTEEGGPWTSPEDGPRRYDGLRIHDLRHTAVALWIAAGASPKEVATRAGHSSVVTVLDRYGHLLPGSEDRVTDALDAMARSVTPGEAPSVVMLASAGEGRGVTRA